MDRKMQGRQNVIQEEEEESGYDNNLHIEIMRLITLLPSTIPYPYKQLVASKGFFYNVNTNSIACFSCTSDLSLSTTIITDSYWPNLHHTNCNQSNNIPLLSNLNDFCYAQNRLMTFMKHSQGCRQKYLEQALQLAESGFYLMLQDYARVVIKCAFCNLQAFCFEKRDMLAEHRLGNCPLLYGLRYSNVKIGEEGDQLRDFLTNKSRLETYNDWLKSPDYPAPEILSDAGFFYSGRSDHVICYKCDLGLKNWCKVAIPIVEHKYHEPNCWHVRNVTVKQYSPRTSVLTEEEKVADRTMVNNILCDTSFQSVSGIKYNMKTH